MSEPRIRQASHTPSLRRLGFMIALMASLLSLSAQAHRSGPVGPTTGLSIPTLTHGQMAVIANHYSDILDLADRQIFTDEPFRRYRNYIALQYAVCVWGLMPGSLKDENSPFNECSHGYLAGARTLLLYMKTMPRVKIAAAALADRINLEMLTQNASLVVCRYSDEPFNTADVVLPHWGDVPFHLPSLLALASVLATLGGALTVGFRLLRRARSQAGVLAAQI